MTQSASTMDTDEVSPRERTAYWSHWLDRLFQGLRSDLYGDTRFDGRVTTVRAGDVLLTRLEADRHRVTHTDAQVRSSSMGYLKIVAPLHGRAGVQQHGHEAWVQPGQWCIYDTTDAYTVSNPAHVEHLIVMLPRQDLDRRGLAINALMARQLGTDGGIARVTLETMRSAWCELPGMGAEAARGMGELITQCVYLSLLDLAGRSTAQTQREALRERIKQIVTLRLADPQLTVDGIASVLNVSRRRLYDAFTDEPDGVAGYVLHRRLQACLATFSDGAQQHRSITDIALGFGFSNPAHFSRVFRSRFGLTPSDYRRAAVRPAPQGTTAHAQLIG
jgi:AraC-like DNA-binding protein